MKSWSDMHLFSGNQASNSVKTAATKWGQNQKRGKNGVISQSFYGTALLRAALNKEQCRVSTSNAALCVVAASNPPNHVLDTQSSKVTRNQFSKFLFNLVDNSIFFQLCQMVAHPCLEVVKRRG